MQVVVHWWGSKQTTIEFHFPVVWTWEDFEIADRQAREIFDSIQHKADIILLFDPKGRLPENSFAHIRRFIAKPHPNQGVVVIVGLNVFMRMVGSVMESAYPHLAKDRRLAASLEEALDIVARVQQERIQPCS